MRLALTVEGGFKEVESGFAAALEPAVARILADFHGAELLILPAAGIAGAIRTANLPSSAPRSRPGVSTACRPAKPPSPAP